MNIKTKVCKGKIKQFLFYNLILRKYNKKGEKKIKILCLK
jgi:hypothetical protein